MMALAIPIVRDSATTRRERSSYATAAGDRSKHCRSVAPWSNRNQSYDPDIVRSGVTVTFAVQCMNGCIGVGPTSASIVRYIRNDVDLWTQ